ncbi:hypothetical protein HPB48_011273 [Haemaphysalis longicornis]|uniref:Uncharacterized protein n=1 Tax=Haemaphysalis longicornis TaxID=44386 RepID=A0A9J6G3M3_HAELO|nr:hypothetical protein HPB48_011273 [Haemaphysalis longicornis]
MGKRGRSEGPKVHDTAGILYGKGADATRTKQALKQDVGWFGVRSERRRRTEYNSVPEGVLEVPLAPAAFSMRSSAAAPQLLFCFPAVSAWRPARSVGRSVGWLVGQTPWQLLLRRASCAAPPPPPTGIPGVLPFRSDSQSSATAFLSTPAPDCFRQNALPDRSFFHVLARTGSSAVLKEMGNPADGTVRAIPTESVRCDTCLPASVGSRGLREPFRTVDKGGNWLAIKAERCLTRADVLQFALFRAEFFSLFLSFFASV